MKSDDPCHEIGELLRSQKSSPQPSPELEARILHSLSIRPREVRRIWSSWWLLPPAAAAAWALFSAYPTSPPASPPITQAPVSHSETPAPSVALPLDEWNPLEAEAKALGDDAEKAGRFLIDCLPSFDLAGN